MLDKRKIVFFDNANISRTPSFMVLHINFIGADLTIFNHTL